MRESEHAITTAWIATVVVLANGRLLLRSSAGLLHGYLISRPVARLYISVRARYNEPASDDALFSWETRVSFSPAVTYKWPRNNFREHEIDRKLEKACALY